MENIVRLKVLNLTPVRVHSGLEFKEYSPLVEIQAIGRIQCHKIELTHVEDVHIYLNCIFQCPLWIYQCGLDLVICRLEPSIFGITGMLQNILCQCQQCLGNVVTSCTDQTCEQCT